MNVEVFLAGALREVVLSLYGADLPLDSFGVQETRREFEGDFTFVVFPLVKLSRKSPEQTAREIGELLCAKTEQIAGFSVVKGFLNLSLSPAFWYAFLYENRLSGPVVAPSQSPRSIMIEYSSPNTNKPLHLGHIRNNLLGAAMANVLKACGHKVTKVNLVNDRGIHICKSMLAWQRWGEGATPGTTQKKGDHLVGDYYVKFDVELKKETAALTASGLRAEEAAKKAPLMLEAQQMLRLWESRDEAVIDLWKTMNGWVYEGFSQTYQRLGITFDRTYYESETYLLGKEIVMEGLHRGVLQQKEDGSVWADLTSDGLDEKLLLRADGTSVYMTQDIGTACQRFAEYPIDEHIYVVGNEQNYHFQVLSLILAKLGYTWAKAIYHMSYGMVELPEGKMKSREGTVVDADDLMDEMLFTARTMSEELGKLDGLAEADKAEMIRRVGMGALKYFILKVDPKKNMTFDPRESIDFNGNTGPFIQYTYARIRSVLRKAQAAGLEPFSEGNSYTGFDEKERNLIRLLYRYAPVVANAGETYNPSLIANYVYELTKEYNQFYHDHRIIQEEEAQVRAFRISLSARVAETLLSGMSLLGIELPERM
ncbi:MAG: arginine--tRNA ligase [Bacteroidales bacterium]